MARIKGSSGKLELAGVSAWNGTGTLHTWLLVQLHPGGLSAKRNLAGKLCRQVLLRQCGDHKCLHVSLPTASAGVAGSGGEQCEERDMVGLLTALEGAISRPGDRA